MSKFDPGTKQTCPECAAKFYDLTKRPAVCPKCAHSFSPGAGAKVIKKRDLEPEPAEEKGDDEEGDSKPVATEEEDIEGLDAEDEEAESLSLDSDEPKIMVGGDDDDEDSDPAESGKALPEGFTEEGVEDDADILADDDDEEIDLDDDLEED